MSRPRLGRSRSVRDGVSVTYTADSEAHRRGRRGSSVTLTPLHGTESSPPSITNEPAPRGFRGDARHMRTIRTLTDRAWPDVLLLQSCSGRSPIRLRFALRFRTRTLVAPGPRALGRRLAQRAPVRPERSARISQRRALLSGRPRAHASAGACACGGAPRSMSCRAPWPGPRSGAAGARLPLRSRRRPGARS
jgi:hypothetical protein